MDLLVVTHGTPLYQVQTKCTYDYCDFLLWVAAVLWGMIKPPQVPHDVPDFIFTVHEILDPQMGP